MTKPEESRAAFFLVAAALILLPLAGQREAVGASPGEPPGSALEGALFLIRAHHYPAPPGGAGAELSPRAWPEGLRRLLRELGTGSALLRLPRREVDEVRGVGRKPVVRLLGFLPAGEAWVRVDAFLPRTPAEVDRAVSEAVGGGARSLLLDLRGSPGGQLASALSAAARFVRRGEVLLFERNRGGVRALRAEAAGAAGRWAGMALRVVVDGATASAAEAFAAALAGARGVPVLGGPSRGKGTVQTLYPLPGGYLLALTTGELLDRGGVPLEGRGVGGRLSPPPGLRAAGTRGALKERGIFGMEEKPEGAALVRHRKDVARAWDGAVRAVFSR